jgi:hypothetical protein
MGLDTMPPGLCLQHDWFRRHVLTDVIFLGIVCNTAGLATRYRP